MTDAPTSLLLVTGMSGAGKSIALKMLEDSGYYCVDNLPLALLPQMADTLQERPDITHLAVGVDARNAPADIAQFDTVVHSVEARALAVTTLYLDARDDVLLARYSATRRRHPGSSGAARPGTDRAPAAGAGGAARPDAYRHQRPQRARIARPAAHPPGRPAGARFHGIVPVLRV